MENGLGEGVLTCTQNLCFEEKRAKNHFTTLKHCGVLHGQVFVLCLRYENMPI